jgi:hypothetical protein
MAGNEVVKTYLANCVPGISRHANFSIAPRLLRKILYGVVAVTRILFLNQASYPQSGNWDEHCSPNSTYFLPNSTTLWRLY